MSFILGTLIGIVAACFTSFSYLPQVIKMARRKSVSDVSTTTIYQLGIGCALWLTYGIYRIDFVMIAANVVMISFLVMSLLLYYKYRVKEKVDSKVVDN
jgi:MtN3 and saliva related transmembrane protein